LKTRASRDCAALKRTNPVALDAWLKAFPGVNTTPSFRHDPAEALQFLLIVLFCASFTPFTHAQLPRSDKE
jgi:hypothetical protein